MPGVCRLGDKAKVELDSHGCPGCPHTAVGPAISASSNVFINGVPALRLGDIGIHAACCGANIWKVVQASGGVYINGSPAVRKGDKTLHCSTMNGKMIEASGNVNDFSPMSGIMEALHTIGDFITQHVTPDVLLELVAGELPTLADIAGTVAGGLGVVGLQHALGCDEPGRRDDPNHPECREPPPKPPEPPEPPEPQHPVPVEPSRPPVPATDSGPSTGDYILGGLGILAAGAAAAVGQEEIAVPVAAGSAKLVGAG